MLQPKNKLTLPNLVSDNATKYPNDIAIREKKFGIWKVKTWLQCIEEVKMLALALKQKGVKPGQTIGILGNNTPRWLLAEIATQSIGCAALGIYSDALETEIDYLLSHSSCSVLFVEDEEQADKILSLKDSSKKINLVIYDEPKGMSKYTDERLISYEHLKKQGDELNRESPQTFKKMLDSLSEEDICILCPTSGTTANPKLAKIQHKAIIKHAKKYLKADPKNHTDEYVSVLPLPWIMEQTYAVAKWCVSRMKVNFVEDPDTMFQDLREIGPTFLLLAPRVWEQMAADIRAKMMDSSSVKRFLFAVSMKLLDFENSFLKKTVCELFINRWLRDRFGLSFLKSAATGGAALGPDTFKFFVNIGIPLKQLYGQTEQLGAWTIHNKDDVDFDSVGFPFDGIELKIDKPDSEGIGEITVKNSNTMMGYLDAKADFLKKGWFYTGDAGYINKNGHLVVIDRMSDLSYTSQKLRYSPQYIENKLKFSTYIAEAAVIGSGKPFLSSIVCIRFSVLSKWAENNRIAFTTYSDLATKKEVQTLITKEVEKVNLTLPDKQKIKKIVLLYKEFDADDDELTRTRKLRRNFVVDKYIDIVEAIYASKDYINVNTQIKLQDGGVQKINTTLKIISME